MDVRQEIEGEGDIIGIVIGSALQKILEMRQRSCVKALQRLFPPGTPAVTRVYMYV